MARFEATNVSDADVAAPREKIWAVISSPERLAELTPLIEGITTAGDVWRWQLRRISALGIHVAPFFTEQMSFEAGHRLRFQHRPPAGTNERAGAKGTYTLVDLADGGTHVKVDLTFHVELPLPALSRPAVQRVMSTMMTRAGQKFAQNLSTDLGLAGGRQRRQEPDAPAPPPYRPNKDLIGYIEGGPQPPTGRTPPGSENR